MYARIFVVAHKRQKMLRNGELGETSTGQNQTSVLRQDLKNVRMLLINCGRSIFVLLASSQYFPFVGHLYRSKNFKGWSYNKSYTIYKKATWLLPMINSLCNPIIYTCLDQTYREAFKNLFQKMMCRTRSNPQQPPAVIELRPLRNN